MRYIFKNRELFSKLWPKNYNFITAKNNIIKFEEISIVDLFVGRGKVTLFNVIYTPKCDSNLILLGQFQELEILSDDYLKFMILKQKRSTIRLAMKYTNFFVLEIRHKNNAMLLRRRSRPIYLFSSNFQIQFWYCHLDYAHNVRVIQVSKLGNRINFRDLPKVIKESYSFNSKSDNNFNKDSNNRPAPINKVTNYNIEGIEKLCKACIANKHIRIVKSKKITSTTKRLQEILAYL